MPGKGLQSNGKLIIGGLGIGSSPGVIKPHTRSASKHTPFEKVPGAFLGL
jgi:hypothetical protein